MIGAMYTCRDAIQTSVNSSGNNCLDINAFDVFGEAIGIEFGSVLPEVGVESLHLGLLVLPVRDFHVMVLRLLAVVDGNEVSHDFEFL